jgi:hypothetical protein
MGPGFRRDGAVGGISLGAHTMTLQPMETPRLSSDARANALICRGHTLSVTAIGLASLLFAGSAREEPIPATAG